MNKNIVYFPSKMGDGILIGIDKRDIVAVFFEPAPSRVIGEDPEEICMVFSKTIGESKPIRLKADFRTVIDILGWPQYEFPSSIAN